MIIRPFAWQVPAAVLLTTGIIGMPPLAWSSSFASSAVVLPVASGKAQTIRVKRGQVKRGQVCF